MNGIIKGMIRLSGVICVMIVISCIFSVLLCSIPSRGMKDNVLESLNKIENEGFKHRIGDIPLFCLDNFTDVIIISNAYCVDADKPLESVMRNTTYLAGDIKSIIPATRLFAEGNYDAITSTDYVRYWHGSSYLIRPLLLFTDINGIRVLGGIIMSLLAVCLAFLLYSRSRLLFSAFLFSAVIMNLWIVPLSIQFTSVFYISLISSIIILLKKNIRYCELFAVIGCLTSYFDLLTVPLVTLGMPLTILLSTDDSAISEKWRKLIVCSLSWVMGYGVLWASKWLLAYLIIGYDVTEAYKTIAFRTSTMFAGYDFSVAGIIGYLLSANRLIFVLLMLFIIGFLVFNYILFRKKRNAFANNSYLLAIAVMPFVWCMVLRNHSIIHYWFVWRVFFVSLFAYILFLFNVVKKDKLTVS